MMRHSLTLLIIVTICCICDGFKILGIFPLSVKSRFIVNNAIMKSLIDAGHDVTIITAFPEQASAENYNTVISSVTDDFIFVGQTKFTYFLTMSLYDYLEFSVALTNKFCQKVMKLPIIQKMMNSDKKLYDVIFFEIIELYECYLQVAEKMKIPVIGTVTTKSGILADHVIGNPSNPAIIPFNMYGSFKNERFYDRLSNFGYFTFNRLHRYFVVEPILDKFYRENVQQYGSMKNYKNRRPDLIFYNNHASYISRPVTPNGIEIAGIHVEKAKSLSQDIQKFIDEAKHGVILFTFGSVTKAAASSDHVISAFRDAFAEIPQRVIWKFEEEMKNVSSNVMIKDWLPQRDILEHRNVKAFVSHCGQAGVYEAIYTATPVVACPLFLDQFANADLLENSNVAVRLDINTISKQNVLKALNAIINNTRYYDNMQKLSAAFKDRPMTPQQSVVYWTEYVVKHNGAPHLKTAAPQLKWYQYYLLDILGTIILCLVVIIYFVFITIKFACRILALN